MGNERRIRRFAIELILLGLDSGRVPLVKTSLECIASLGAAGRFRNAHRQVPVPSDSAVRIAAVRAGVAGLDWEDALAREKGSSGEDRDGWEASGRERHCCGADDRPPRSKKEISGCVRQPQQAALQRLGKGAVEDVKPLMEHPAQSVKVAAAQVLIAAGEDLWLKEKILS